jgi:hypothetical protein
LVGNKREKIGFQLLKILKRLFQKIEIKIIYYF